MTASNQPVIPARVLAVRDTFSACEQRLARGPRSVPTMAIAGASYTAGVGPDNPALAWSVLLAQAMHWKAAIYGVSGAGYTSLGAQRLGPVSRLLSAERLHRLAPSLVIVQAGYNDARVPARVEKWRVRQTIEQIHTQAPGARIALLTVFTVPAKVIPAQFYRTDREIVAAGRAADPNVIIMDPLLGRWRYQRYHHGLHPTAAGDAWIARKAETILRNHAIFPATPPPLPPVICDVAVTSGQQQSQVSTQRS